MTIVMNKGGLDIIGLKVHEGGGECRKSGINWTYGLRTKNSKKIISKSFGKWGFLSISCWENILFLA